jgi:hypothetical protein
MSQNNDVDASAGSIIPDSELTPEQLQKRRQADEYWKKEASYDNS